MLLGRLLGIERKQAEERAAELLDAFGLVDAADRLVSTYSGRHAPPPRHRGQHRGHARPAVPRRADHRPRPPEPQPGVGDHPRPRRRGNHRAADDPAPRRGRPARRPHRHHRPRQGDRRGHAGRAQGVRRRRARCTSALADPDQRDEAQRVLAGRARRRAVHLDVRSRRAVRPRRPIPCGWRPPSSSWPTPASPSPSSPLGQPSLDEVFLALTGHPAEDRPPTKRRTQHDRPRRRTGPERGDAAVRALHPRPRRRRRRRCRPRSPSRGGPCSRSSTCRCSCST